MRYIKNTDVVLLPMNRKEAIGSLQKLRYHAQKLSVDVSHYVTSNEKSGFRNYDILDHVSKVFVVSLISEFLQEIPKEFLLRDYTFCMSKELQRIKNLTKDFQRNDINLVISVCDFMLESEVEVKQKLGEGYLDVMESPFVC